MRPLFSAVGGVGLCCLTPSQSCRLCKRHVHLQPASTVCTRVENVACLPHFSLEGVIFVPAVHAGNGSAYMTLPPVLIRFR